MPPVFSGVVIRRRIRVDDLRSRQVMFLTDNSVGDALVADIRSTRGPQVQRGRRGSPVCSVLGSAPQSTWRSATSPQSWFFRRHPRLVEPAIRNPCASRRNPQSSHTGWSGSPHRVGLRPHDVATRTFQQLQVAAGAPFCCEHPGDLGGGEAFACASSLKIGVTPRSTAILQLRFSFTGCLAGNSGSMTRAVRHRSRACGVDAISAARAARGRRPGSG